jgi:hypothetical protein
MDINWTVTLLLGAVLSIPFGILANLLTPRVQDWLVKRSLTSRGKTLARLKQEYEGICKLRDDSSLLGLRTTQMIFMALGTFFGIILILALMPVFYVLGTSSMPFPAHEMVTQVFLAIVYAFVLFFALVVFLSIYGFYDDILRLLEFEEYKRKTLTRIAELEREEMS